MTKNAATAMRLPAALLYALAASVLLCVSTMALLYCFWSLNETVSGYRRHMNAAAYRAQLFFDQREQLLRATAASAIRKPHPRHAPGAAGLSGLSRQLEVHPLPEGDNRYEWALVMTPRDVHDCSRVQTTLVYTSLRSGSTLPVFSDHDSTTSFISTETQKWIAGALSRENPRIGISGNMPLVWLNPPTGDGQRLFLYTPIDGTDTTSGWLGITFEDIDSALALTSMARGSYVLYDAKGNATLRDAQAPDTGRDALRITPTDNFGIVWQGSIPKYLALSKSVGHAGWHLKYYVPVSQLSRDNATELYGALALCAGLAVILLLASFLIHRKLLVPARSNLQALISSVALNRKLLKTAPVGLALLRPGDSDPLLSNELAHAWLKTERDWKHIVASNDPAEVDEDLELEDGRVVQRTLTPMTYCGGPAMLCTINDVTKLKQAEMSLVNAMQAAEAANQAKTLFLTTMSHEMRTPLYGILGTLELLSLTKATEQQRQYLDTLHHSSRVLLSTVNDTLDLSRIEAGHLTLEQRPVALLEMLDNVIDTFCVRAERKNLRLYSTASVDTPLQVLGDITRLRQVLDNLVSNAIKFTPSGHIVLRLRSMPIDELHVQLEFEVADTGIGIASEHLPQLFQPYFRTDSDPGQHIQGTGLGLSICSRLSQMMGGELTATSELGIGTRITFKVTLPIAADSTPAYVPSLSPDKILVRGAIPEVVRNLCNWLRHWGAMAVPYRDHPSSSERQTLLIETWPWAMPLAQGQHRRIVMHPPGARPGIAADRNTLLTCAHGIMSLARSIQGMQEGRRLDKATGKAEPEPLNMHLLVVEDNPISQLILREQLQHLGCTVAVAANGQMALSRPDIQDFDAILTDLHMPVLNGYEMAFALREHGYARPILGLTANAFPEEQRRGQTSGIDVLLIKPLAIDQLRKILNSIKAEGS
ncbi:MAG: response regulator [Comamonas sp.]|jgi:two-component system capsular synthesis sensor histidine kinase RcsC|uniref:ATP-binding protein n=1 Tax=Comamonas sp. TaxID=34028 RepID=UPI0028464FA9|nr:ATP-binding protein [Comamonas sp.]MDR3064522.1 response regulator [Comamonas sp.]